MAPSVRVFGLDFSFELGPEKILSHLNHDLFLLPVRDHLLLDDNHEIGQTESITTPTQRWDWTPCDDNQMKNLHHIKCLILIALYLYSTFKQFWNIFILRKQCKNERRLAMELCEEY